MNYLYSQNSPPFVLHPKNDFRLCNNARRFIFWNLFLDLAVSLRVFALLQEQCGSVQGCKCLPAMGCDIWEWVSCWFDLLIDFLLCGWIWHLTLLSGKVAFRKYLDNVLHLHCVWVPPPLRRPWFHLSLCLSVSRIAQKLLNQFPIWCLSYLVS